MKQSTKDNISWVLIGVLIATIGFAVLFDRIKKSVIRGCLDNNSLFINDVVLECRLNVNQFKGEIASDADLLKKVDADLFTLDNKDKSKSVTITIDGK